MPDGYDSHADYMGWIKAESDARAEQIREGILGTFSHFIERREIEVINFSAMTVLDLANAIRSNPSILKALMACCNVAGRAIERDLDIRGINTYTPRLSEPHAAAIAGYLKPFLPQEMPVPALCELDRFFFADKEIRARKGRWEQVILQALNSQSHLRFKKRKFKVGDEWFELDAAAPEEGAIQVGIDVKRIEARRDIHKRADEIINKATKFKRAFRRGRFAAVIYYPFTVDHVNLQSRLKSPAISAICFASQSEEQIAISIGLLVDRLGIRK